MIHPTIKADECQMEDEKCQDHVVADTIARWSCLPGVLAWKMPGAGGGGYLALVVEDCDSFCLVHPEAIPLTIRRK